MFQAYQHLELDDKSRKFTTINTHKGFSQYKWLPFGILSAPRIFQCVMETLLQGIPHVVVRIDDILVSGKDDADHPENVRAIVTKLSKASLWLRQAKWFFMKSEVMYCGYIIKGEGIQPVAAKLEAIQNAPPPKDVNQLQAFLRMLNYYHRFPQDVATVLEPIHKLLKKGTVWRWNSEQQAAFETSLCKISIYMWNNVVKQLNGYQKELTAWKCTE